MNQSVREGLGEVYDGLDRFMYIASNGCGDYHGYRINDGKVACDEIVMWEHETNETYPAANSIIELINRYFNNEI